MSHDKSCSPLPAPCIIDSGIIVNKEDIRRLLNDLGQVRYCHILEGKIQSEDEGWILEVFSHCHQATLIANHTLYLNIQSFDYLQLQQSPDREPYFDLVQDNRTLRLIPLSNPLDDPDTARKIDPATLEAMVSEVLSAKWDVQIDDDDDCPF
jgi:hypothetical protein